MAGSEPAIQASFASTTWLPSFAGHLLLVGYGERRKGETILFILPLVFARAFFLIADLDSPRGGVIRVHPHNLMAASQAVQPRQP